MKTEILDKKSGARRIADNDQNITLDRPSVVVLKLAPENVARYERRGDDLILVLKDGREIAIHGFFVKYPEGDSAEEARADAPDGSAEDAAVEEARSELVLEDDNGVTWWGQYPEQWSEFHFTEIEWDYGAVAAWPWVLGALGAAGAGALALGSGGDSDNDSAPPEPEAHPPVALDDTATGDEDDGPITGNVLTNDSDPDDDTLTVTQFTIGGETYDAGDSATIEGIGTITVRSDGSYSFTPNANWNGTVPPVTYTISDGNGGTDTAKLTITVKRGHRSDRA